MTTGCELTKGLKRMGQRTFSGGAFLVPGTVLGMLLGLILGVDLGLILGMDLGMAPPPLGGFILHPLQRIGRLGRDDGGVCEAPVRSGLGDLRSSPRLYRAHDV